MADQKKMKKQAKTAHRLRRTLTYLLLFAMMFAALTGCKSGYHPIDDLLSPTAKQNDRQAQETIAPTPAAAQDTDEPAAEVTGDSPAEVAEDATEPAVSDDADHDAQDAEPPAAAETEQKPTTPETTKPATDEPEKATPTTTAAPEPQGPDTNAIRKSLEAEGFKFYVNNMLKDPEPQEVIYADREVGKAELTVLYGVFENAEEADRAIRSLLESDMIGKAISFGAKLDQAHDEVDSKQYFVSLNSLFATARAELRQEGERIGVVILFKKNNDVVFEPYFELMELPEP